MTISKIKRRLSDGSHVFDVEIADAGNAVCFHAVTDDDAESMIRGLHVLCDNHTTDIPNRNVSFPRAAAVRC